MPCLNKIDRSSMNPIAVGARSSPLSRTQVQEILSEIHYHDPTVQFNIQYLLTTGDQDQKTSLRSLNKTNFFTKEIDELVLKGQCRIGIHSAKDLPDPLPTGLALICLTKGVDSSDALVFRSGETLIDLPKGALIATSSVCRENKVKQLRPDLTFSDLRGTIEQRLAKLDRREVDGVVVAEAALIRLKLTHLNRILLPGPTTKGQGQLAVLARENDLEMRQLFASIDSRLKVVD